MLHLKLTRQQALLLQFVLEHWITDTKQFKREETILKKLRETLKSEGSA